MNLLGILIWLLVGGIVGWLASIVVGTNARQGLLGNIVVGILGAFIGGLIFNRGQMVAPEASVTSFLVALLGAVVLLVIVSLVWRRRFL
jgi:uncharacterized membrane protein YeaQ/YmgE (transglycosylase-associated protein family)